MLLLLQRRGRMTAADLAGRLEVSERTVLRDVEALSEAGIPVYTSRGTGGGIELLPGFTTDLTGLTEQEAACLFLVGQPEVAGRLGLRAPARSATAKLAAALPAGAGEQAEALATWFLHDPEAWTGPGPQVADVRRLRRAIAARCRVELTLPDGAALVVEPLGVVLKAGAWYLVTGPRASQGPPDVVPLDGAVARVTAHRFEPPSGFSLHRFWRQHLATHAHAGTP